MPFIDVEFINSNCYIFIVRSPEAAATCHITYEDELFDHSLSASMNITNAMMSFANRCISGEHIPTSALKNIVMLAVAEDSTPPPAHVRSSRRMYGRRYGQVNANNGYYNRLSHRSHSCDSRFDDNDEYSVRIAPKPRSSSATRAKSETRTKSTRGRPRKSFAVRNNNDTIKRSTRTRNTAPAEQPNNTKMFLYIAPFCDKSGTQSKVSFYVDNPEVNYSELYNVGNQQNPIIVLNNIDNIIPHKYIRGFHKSPDPPPARTQRRTRATTPRRANVVRRKRGRPKKEITETPTLNKAALIVEPKKINFDQITTSTAISGATSSSDAESSPSPLPSPRLKTSQLLRKRPTEKAIIDTTDKETSPVEKQRTYLTPHIASSEDDIYLQSDSEESEIIPPLQIEEGTGEFRRSLENFFSKLPAPSTDDDAVTESYPTTQDDMINRNVINNRDLLSRLRKRLARSSSLPSTSSRHVVGDEIEEDMETEDSKDDEDTSESSSGRSSTTTSTSTSSLNTNSGSTSVSIDSPIKMDIETTFEDYAPEDILRVVTGETKSFKVIKTTIVDSIPSTSEPKPSTSTNVVKKNGAISIIDFRNEGESFLNPIPTNRDIESHSIANTAPSTKIESDDDTDRLVIDESASDRRPVRTSKKGATYKKTGKSKKKLLEVDQISTITEEAIKDYDNKIEKNPENIIKSANDNELIPVSSENSENVIDKEGSDNNITSTSPESRAKVIDEVDEVSKIAELSNEEQKSVTKPEDIKKQEDIKSEKDNSAEKQVTTEDTKIKDEFESKEMIVNSPKEGACEVKENLKEDLISAAVILDVWRTVNKVAVKIKNSRSVASIVDSTQSIIAKKTSAVVDLPVETIPYALSRKDYSKADAERDLFKLLQKDEAHVKDKFCDNKDVTKSRKNSKSESKILTDDVDKKNESETKLDQVPDINKDSVGTPTKKSVDSVPCSPVLYDVSSFVDVITTPHNVDDTSKSANEDSQSGEDNSNILANEVVKTPEINEKPKDINNKDIKPSKILYVVRGKGSPSKAVAESKENKTDENDINKITKEIKEIPGGAEEIYKGVKDVKVTEKDVKATAIDVSAIPQDVSVPKKETEVINISQNHVKDKNVDKIINEDATVINKRTNEDSSKKNTKRMTNNATPEPKPMRRITRSNTIELNALKSQSAVKTFNDDVKPKRNSSKDRISSQQNHVNDKWIKESVLPNSIDKVVINNTEDSDSLAEKIIEDDMETSIGAVEEVHTDLSNDKIDDYVGVLGNHEEVALSESIPDDKSKSSVKGKRYANTKTKSTSLKATEVVNDDVVTKVEASKSNKRRREERTAVNYLKPMHEDEEKIGSKRFRKSQNNQQSSSQESKIKVMPDLMPIRNKARIQLSDRFKNKQLLSDLDGQLLKLKGHMKNYRTDIRDTDNETFVNDNIQTTEDLKNILSDDVVSSKKKSVEDTVMKLFARKQLSAKPTATIVRPQVPSDATKRKSKPNELGTGVKTPGQLKYIPPIAAEGQKSWQNLESILGNNNIGYKKMDDYKIPKTSTESRKKEDLMQDNKVTESEKQGAQSLKADVLQAPVDDAQLPRNNAQTVRNETQPPRSISQSPRDEEQSSRNNVQPPRNNMQQMRQSRQAKVMPKAKTMSEVKTETHVPIVSSTTSERSSSAKRSTPIVFVSDEYANNLLSTAVLPKLSRRKNISVTIDKLAEDLVKRKLQGNPEPAKISATRKSTAKRDTNSRADRKPRMPNKRQVKKSPEVDKTSTTSSNKTTKATPIPKNTRNTKNTKRRLGMAVVINNSQPKKRKTNNNILLDEIPVCGDTPKRRSNRRKSVLFNESPNLDLVNDDTDKVEQAEEDEEDDKFPVPPGAATELMYPSDDSLGSEYFRSEYTAEECEDFRDDSSPEPLIVEIEEVQVSSSVDNLTLDDPPEYSAEEIKQHFFS